MPGKACILGTQLINPSRESLSFSIGIKGGEQELCFGTTQLRLKFRYLHLAAVWPETGVYSHSGSVSSLALHAARKQWLGLYAFSSYSSHLKQWQAVISMWQAFKYLLNERRSGNNYFYRVLVRMKWNNECKLHSTVSPQLPLIFLFDLLDSCFTLLYSGSGLGFSFV